MHNKQHFDTFDIISKLNNTDQAVTTGNANPHIGACGVVLAALVFLLGLTTPALAASTADAQLNGLAIDLIERCLRHVVLGTNERALELARVIEHLEAISTPSPATEKLCRLRLFALALVEGTDIPEDVAATTWDSSAGPVTLRKALADYRHALASEHISNGQTQARQKAMPPPIPVEAPPRPHPPGDAGVAQPSKAGGSNYNTAAGIALASGAGLVLAGALVNVYIADRRDRIRQGGDTSGLAARTTSEQSALWSQARTAASVRDGFYITGAAAIVGGFAIWAMKYMGNRYSNVQPTAGGVEVRF